MGHILENEHFVSSETRHWDLKFAELRDFPRRFFVNTIFYIFILRNFVIKQARLHSQSHKQSVIPPAVKCDTSGRCDITKSAAELLLWGAACALRQFCPKETEHEGSSVGLQMWPEQDVPHFYFYSDTWRLKQKMMMIQRKNICRDEGWSAR